MGQLQIFDFKDHPVRAFEDDGEIYFVANDVCLALEYVNPRKAISDHIDPEDVTKRDTLSNGGRQEMNCVNESGLYSLIFGSKKPAAKKFKRWVTAEVLPAIRKTGSYSLNTESKVQMNTEEYVRILKENCEQQRQINAAKFEDMLCNIEKRVACSLIVKTALSNNAIAEIIETDEAVVDYYRSEVARVVKLDLNEGEDWRDLVAPLGRLMRH